MSFISRFLKFGRNDNALDETEQVLTEDSEDGLFMSSRPWENRTQADEPAAEASADELADEAAVEAPADDRADEAAVEAPADELADEAAEEAPGDELTDEAAVEAPAGADAGDSLDGGQDDLAEAAPAEAPAEEAEASLGAGDESPLKQVSGGGEEGGDDLLSAFRETESESASGELTKYLEDIPMQELLTDLREIRGSISAPIHVEDDEVEEDVA